MNSNNLSTYSVDMVFCIDATGSMGKVIDMVKNNALSFYNDLQATMGAKNKNVNSLRIRVVAFRDYLADGKGCMLTTDFFKLPEQSEDFRRCVMGIEASGGGDIPEDGLEALAYAIRSKWDTAATKKRQVIVVWTDASTHELGFGKESEFYPKNMAKTFGELSEWWGDVQLPSDYINQQAKRLILFAPDEPGWSTISENWDNVIHYPSTAGNGLAEVDYMTIIDTISNSI